MSNVIQSQTWRIGKDAMQHGSTKSEDLQAYLAALSYCRHSPTIQVTRLSEETLLCHYFLLSNQAAGSALGAIVVVEGTFGGAQQLAS